MNQAKTCMESLKVLTRATLLLLINVRTQRDDLSYHKTTLTRKFMYFKAQKDFAETPTLVKRNIFACDSTFKR